MKRLALSALLATFAVLTATPTAFAHTELLSSDPANGATLPQPPTKLTLTFSEPVPAESATIAITAPDGTQWQAGEITASGPTLTAQVTPKATPPGQYILSWQVLALDGDYVNGKTIFSLASTPTPLPLPTPTTPGSTPGSATPTIANPTATVSAFVNSEPAQPQPESGTPIWPWIVGALILIALAVAVTLRLKDRKDQQTTPNDTETPQNDGTPRDDGLPNPPSE